MACHPRYHVLHQDDDHLPFYLSTNRYQLTSSIPLHGARFCMAILSLPIDHQERCHDIFKVYGRPIQLMVVKHIGRGEDCILIAGCGCNRSLVYFLPLALWKDRTIVVISPLLALMREQQEKLQVGGFKAICLDSSQAIDVGLLRRLDKGEFRCVFMTPESILSVGKSSG